MVKRERLVVNKKVPQHTPFHFLSVSSKIFVHPTLILKCDNEPSTKSLQDAVIQACAGVELVPQNPLEVDNMANGRGDMVVRDVKRQRRTLRDFSFTTDKCTHRR